MTYLTRWGTYVLSYFPLYILLFIKHFESIESIKNSFAKKEVSMYFWTLLGIATIISILFALMLVVRFTRGGTPKILEGDYKKITLIRDQEMSYLITYVVPLASLENINESKGLITNLILFFLIGLMYTKNNMVHLNPFYSLLGINVYQLENDSLLSYLSIEEIRKLMKNKDPVYKKSWSSNIFFISKK